MHHREVTKTPFEPSRTFIEKGNNTTSVAAKWNWSEPSWLRLHICSYISSKRSCSRAIKESRLILFQGWFQTCVIRFFFKGDQIQVVPWIKTGMLLYLWKGLSGLLMELESFWLMVSLASSLHPFAGVSRAWFGWRSKLDGEVVMTSCIWKGHLMPVYLVKDRKCCNQQIWLNCWLHLLPKMREREREWEEIFFFVCD